MGENQFQISIDKEYKSFFEQIHTHDPSYSSSRGGPCHKRIVQDAVRLFTLLKVGHVRSINIFICEGCPRQERIAELVRLIENGSAGSESEDRESD